MQFNSYYYILYFLPAVVLLYFLANKIKPVIGQIVLILASLLFYSYGRLNMLIYLFISIFINYSFAILIRRKNTSNKLIVAIPIIINVLLLLYFKYFNFILTNIHILIGKDFVLKDIILPLGISFYTFQQIAYLFAAKNELKDINLIDYLTYILYFPKILMGPLMEPKDFIEQINDKNRKKFNINNLAAGTKVFSFGLLKKVLIADTFANGVNWVYSNIENASSVDCLLLMLFYTFVIYFDFSGYSDMAIGTSIMLNIDLPINFDSPYKALSIRDFWKRWHISLTKFFTKYVYIPLGGNRKGKLYTYINIMMVFLISGLWHGANWTFILWGLLHGIFSCLDRLLTRYEEKLFKPLRWLVTFIIVSILWLLFGADSISQWWSILSKIFSFDSLIISKGLLNTFSTVEFSSFFALFKLKEFINNHNVIYMIIYLIAAFVICLIPKNNYDDRYNLKWYTLVLAIISFIWGLLCLGSDTIFVYFGF